MIPQTYWQKQLTNYLEKSNDTALNQRRIFGIQTTRLQPRATHQKAPDGATEIYAVELSAERQAKAAELGAIVIDPAKVNAVAEIKRLTGGGADVSFEVTGVAPVLKQSIEAIKNDGECVIVSIWEGEASIHPNEIVIKEKTVKGIIAYRDVFPAVLKLMEQGYFSKDKLVTKRIKIDDIVEEGFEALVKEKSQVKILVEPK